MMSKFIVLFLFFYSFASFAEIPASAKKALDCVKEAETQIGKYLSPISSREDAVRLCAGAISNAPVECSKRAKKELGQIPTGSVESINAIDICAGSQTESGPIECAQAAFKVMIKIDNPIKTEEHIITLCRKARNKSPVDCVTELKSELTNNTAALVKNAAEVITFCSQN